MQKLSVIINATLTVKPLKFSARLCSNKKIKINFYARGIVL